MTEDTRRHDRIQGEGDKEAAREYSEATREFVESGKVDEAAKEAGRQDPREADAAERAGKERAKEKDPAVHRDYRRPADD
jgi:hypothetical protein